MPIPRRPLTSLFLGGCSECCSCFGAVRDVMFAVAGRLGSRLLYSINLRIGLEDCLVEAGGDYDMVGSMIFAYLYDGSWFLRVY